MLFRGGQIDKETSVSNNIVELKLTDDVETTTGWKHTEDVVVGDVFTDGTEFAEVINIELNNNIIKYYLKEVVCA